MDSRRRKEMGLYDENDLYEYKPYFYGALAAICVYNQNYSKILFYSGVLFAVASISIFYLRFISRAYSRRIKS